MKAAHEFFRYEVGNLSIYENKNIKFNVVNARSSEIGVHHCSASYDPTDIRIIAQNFVSHIVECAVDQGESGKKCATMKARRSLKSCGRIPTMDNHCKLFISAVIT
jgi:hypothetical protein